MGTRRAWLIAIGLVGFVGCQPLYHGKQKMPNPERTNPPKTAGPATAPVVWNEDCDSHFFEATTKQKPDHATAAAKISAGDAAIAQAVPMANDDKKGTLVLDAIAQYKQALNADPYNAEATYQLAVAYATVRKKKCALDLINRLVALKQDPAVAPDATRLLQAAYSETVFAPFKQQLP